MVKFIYANDLSVDGMRDTRLSLIIDQGGHGSRAAVCDAMGNILSLAHRPVATWRPAPLMVELDGEELLQSILDVIDACLEKLDDEDLGRVEHAALACQRSNVVCWSRSSGQVLSPVISWQDRRANEWLQSHKPDAQQVQDITGLVVNAHYGASKLRWCLDHLPKVAEAREAGDLCYGPMASFLIFRLLRERPLYADAVNASRTLLWDWRTGDWSAYLLQHFDLDVACLPQAVASHYDFGHLDCMGRAIPMRLVTGDLAAALYVNGQPQTGTVYITAGTGAFVQRPCGYEPHLTEGLLGGVVLQDETGMHYSLEGTVNGAGSAFDWLVAEHGIKEWTDLLEQETEAGDLVFINSVSGLGSPYWVGDLPPRFVGQGTERQKVVAVLESIVFLLYENFSCLQQLPNNAEQIVINGGLSQSDGFCQRLANLCQVPVLRLQEREATVKGAARLLSSELQANGRGQWFNPAMDSELLYRYQHWHQTLQQVLHNP